MLSQTAHLMQCCSLLLPSSPQVCRVSHLSFSDSERCSQVLMVCTLSAEPLVEYFPAVHVVLHHASVDAEGDRC